MDAALIKAARRKRAVSHVETQLNRLKWEKSEIQAEYQRVSDIYARHLERINKLAAKNRDEYQDLLDWVNDNPRLREQPPGL